MGVLFHFDIRPGTPSPEPKIYIPVRHYGRNDRDILNGLVGYLRGEGVKDHCIDRYRSMLEALCTHRSMESERGLQTYISVAIKGERLSLASYIAPEIYHSQRWESLVTSPTLE